MFSKASLPLLWAQDVDEQVETLVIAVRTCQCASQVSEQHGIYSWLWLVIYQFIVGICGWFCGKWEV